MRLLLSFLLLCITNISCLFGQTGKSLQINFINRSTEFDIENYSDLPKGESTLDKIEYLLETMVADGYFEASLDSIHSNDSNMIAIIHCGKQYNPGNIIIDEKSLVFMVWKDQYSAGWKMNWKEVNELKNELVLSARNSGYPDATVYLGNVNITGDLIDAVIFLDPGQKVVIDSIVNIGNLDLNNNYLGQLLDIRKGDTYNMEKISKIPEKINRLGFAVLEEDPKIYIEGDQAKIKLDIRKNQADNIELLAGIVPSTGKKINIYGMAEINLYNSFMRGSEISFNWERLRSKTQETTLDIAYPYIFNLPVEGEGGFSLFKMDSSYVNTALRLRLNYLQNSDQKIGLFLGLQNSRLLSYDTLNLDYHQLPDHMDIRSITTGISYELNKLDNNWSPGRGMKFQCSAAFGQKTYRKHDKLQYYYSRNAGEEENLYNKLRSSAGTIELRSRLDKYWWLNKQGTILTSIEAAYIFSRETFENEYYKIGGINSFRGVDGKSISTRGYSNLTLEYRYHFQELSYFLVFTDYSFFEVYPSKIKFAFSFGPGLSLDTKAGNFKLIASLSDYYKPFKIRNTNIHIGYINRF